MNTSSTTNTTSSNTDETTTSNSNFSDSSKTSKTNKTSKIDSHKKTEQKSACIALIGSQWGDEGKGKFCDYLSQQMNVCVKFNGGNNAGHTVIVGEQKYAFHLLPSGIINQNCVNIIGHGTVIHLQSLVEEMEDFEKKSGTKIKNLYISNRAHLVFDFHQELDAMNELLASASKSSQSLGTTKKGIGPAYSDKASRINLRMGDLLSPDFEKKFLRLFQLKTEILYMNANKKETELYEEYEHQLEILNSLIPKIRPYIMDTITLLNELMDSKQTVLLEGANASMLDIDYGTYPYVTSSHPTIGGAIIGAGISPWRLTEVYAIVKAYTTRVGNGYFPTELTDEIGQHLQTVGKEYGTTTGRKRRCGWLDLVVIDYTNLINGYTGINLTKLDILTGLKTLKIAINYVSPDTGPLPHGQYPSDLDNLEKFEVVYHTMPGWMEDISKCRKFEDLPVNCQNYINFIEQTVQVPIRWIGVGPERDEMIIRDSNHRVFTPNISPLFKVKNIDS